jgi:hypothetical protein
MSTDKQKKLLGDEFMDMVSEDLVIPDLELEEACRNGPNILQKYLEYFYAMRREYQKLESEREDMHAKLFKKYRYGIYTIGNRESIKASTNAEAEALMKNEETYVKLKRVCEQTKLKAEYLKDIVENFRSRNFMIKNIVELRRVDKI